MKKHRYKRRARKHFVRVALKVTGIVSVSFAVGLSVLGVERYSAIASDVLPRFSLSNTLENEPETVQRDHYFAMTIVGGRSTISALAQYQRVELALLAKDGEPRAVLRLQKSGRNQPVQEYERALSEAYFSHVWQRLREWEVAQLTNLSPHTEQITKDKPVSFSLATASIASATYRFQFKDGLYDYPNSFEVHAPEQLEDVRYKGVRDLTFSILADSFADVLMQ